VAWEKAERLARIRREKSGALHCEIRSKIIRLTPNHNTGSNHYYHAYP